ncbi:Uncharacterised protein [Corynebacterium renale]|uniref:Uncharacterized protein n=1 Tax=Corynebacterium renale TaxID=1724 RepID=A0A2A9DMH3_9CORY|nr:hypothetical protein ATK06_1029 [Corynebacterium renale]SQI21578.1 Uncharacterised protein [Corynebacterium renale]
MCVCVAAGFVVSKLLTGMSWAATTHTWLDYQGSLPTSLTGLLALILALSTLNQRTRSDDRAAYYDRAQWAINLTLEEDPAKRSAGWAFLEAIADSDWKDSDDEAFAQAVLNYGRHPQRGRERSGKLDHDNKEAQ